MRIVPVLILSILLNAHTSQKPDQVMSLRQRVLSQESYMNLARQWLEYMEENGESVEGHLNAGQALRYAGEKRAVYLRHYRQAVSLDPAHARALDLYGCHLRNKGTPEEQERGLELLERAKNLDPTYGEVLYSLYSAYCCEGRLDEAAGVAGDIYRRQIIPSPLQDFGYNLLAGLPENAVLITNGDNDTYPPISLQAGMDFRPDVVILNRSLLECEHYYRALSERFNWFPERDGSGTRHPFGTAGHVIEHLLDTRSRPVYAAVSVAFGEQPRSITVQGITSRIDDFSKSKQQIDYGRTFDLFHDIYRLDSATYWGYPWDLRNAERLLMKNYAILAYYCTEEALESNDTTTAAWFNRFGKDFAKFHGYSELSAMYTKITLDE